MGMPIVTIAPFGFLKELDKDFFVHPGLRGELSFLKSLKLLTLFVIAIEGRLLKVLHEKADNFLGPFFHPLDVKVDFSANLMLGGTVFLGGVGIEIVGRTPVAAGDDDSLASLFLDVVEEVDEDGINSFLIVDDGKAVARRAFTVGKRGGLRVGGVDEGRIEGTPFTAEKVLGDAG